MSQHRTGAAEPPWVLRVRHGQLADSGSWVYVWLSVTTGTVVYVGATGLPPAARVWLHLHSEDPDVGRVAARLPDVDTEALDVLAFPVPADVPRSAARTALVQRLAASGRLGSSYVGDQPSVEAAPIDQVGEQWLAAALALVGGHRATE